MAKVALTIPHLGVTYGGWEKNKELYVLGFTMDLAGKGRGATTSQINAAHNHIPDLGSGVGGALYDWFLITASNRFERVQRGQAAPLFGSGIVIYPNLDPQGMLATHIVVVESDSKSRNAGKVLKEILEEEAVKNALAALQSAGSASSPLVGEVMRAVTSLIPEVLVRNKDDVIYTADYSGFDYTNYGVEVGRSHQDFRKPNDRCELTLRVYVNH